LFGGFVVQSQILMFNYSERSKFNAPSIDFLNVHKSDGDVKEKSNYCEMMKSNKNRKPFKED
jgi:hypothetical protein